MIAGLPYDAEVEYLESTGTQWIDTGAKYSDGIEMRIDLAPTETVLAWTTGFCGFRTGGNQFSIVGDSSQKYGFWVGATIGSTPVLQALGTKASISLSSNRFSVSSSGIAESVSFAHTNSISNDFNIMVFMGGYSGSSKMRCFAFSIWLNETTAVRDFIPVRFTNENGVSEGAMYDRVSRKLFRNQGTGTFVTGPDVAVPVMGLHFMRRTRYPARNYVQDGLVAMWDGIENAGWGTHDPNAKVWVNLAGTSTLPDLSISEGLSFSSDSLVFPYGAAYRDLRASASTNYAPSGYGYTLEIVIRNASANDLNRDALIFGCNAYQISTISRSSAGGQYSFGYNREGIYSADTSYLASTWANNTATMYSNGAVGTPSTYKGTFGVTGISGVCAINPRADYPFVGEVCALRLYSRALTADEIALNYAVDKERFNLP